MHNAAARLPAAMTDHPLLSADEERAAFARLHEARVAAWLAVLSDRHHAPRCLPASTPGLAEHVVWDAAREAAVMRPVRSHNDAVTWYARPLAERLAADDLRCDALHAAVAVVGRIAPRRATSPAWVRRVGDAMRDLHAAVSHVEEHNLRLVVSEAFRFHRCYPAFDVHDLVGHGAVGLRTAVMQFDLARGCRLSTMAKPWIAHAIRRAIQDTRTTVRVPTHMQERLALVARVRDEHVARTGEEPTPAQVAAASKKYDAAQCAGALDLLAVGTFTVSLDQPVRGWESDGPSVVEALADESAQAG